MDAKPGETLKKVGWWWLLLPVALLGICAYLEASGLIHIHKPRWEAAAVWILRVGVLLGVIGVVLRRSVFSVWLLLLVVAFLPATS